MKINVLAWPCTIALLWALGCVGSPPPPPSPAATSDGMTGTSLTTEPGPATTQMGASEDETTAVMPNPPAKPVLELGFSQVKRFDFSWAPAGGAERYDLLERLTGASEYQTIRAGIIGTSVSLEMPLHLRIGASYKLRAWNDEYTDSEPVDITESLAEAVGYFKAPNTDTGDEFGVTLALSGDGNTLAVGARYEDSNASSVNGDPSDNSALDAGAAYVYARQPSGVWALEAYLKASNAGAGDAFGFGIALSHDGDTLAVGARMEDSNTSGVDGDQSNDLAPEAGAVYVFVRDATDHWAQQAYLKASNADPDDRFGSGLELSADGNTLAVGAYIEDGASIGVNGDQEDDTAIDAGAVYVFTRDAGSHWSQQAYLKASNPDAHDRFGVHVALSADGDTLAASAYLEDGGVMGAGGWPDDDSMPDSGAVYVFIRDRSAQWSQQAYLKASTIDAADLFGGDVALSADGNTLAVGAYHEDGGYDTLDGDPTDDSAPDAGAAYIFVRDATSQWSQQAYLKASNASAGDEFGYPVVLSADGNVLAIGAVLEDGGSPGVGGDETNDAATNSGAAFVFLRTDAQWSRGAYLKAPNVDASDEFAYHLGMSADGNTLAVGAVWEDGSGIGIGGDPDNDAAADAGAVYLF